MGMRQETFTSPGTWTNPNPSVVTRVRVHLIGGGGGGSGGVVGPALSPTFPSSTFSGSGGGGGYKTAIVPVSGPQPVIVGAGGAGGVDPSPAVNGAVGGTSSFGSGPSAVSVDGGGAGVQASPTTPTPSMIASLSAPPNGGGGGANRNDVGNGGLGFPGIDAGPSGLGTSRGHSGGGMFTYIYTKSGERVNAIQRMYAPTHPYGHLCGGGNTGVYGGGTSYNPFVTTPTSGGANTGGGGAGVDRAPTPVPTIVPAVGGNGGSGLVVVEWYE